MAGAFNPNAFNPEAFDTDWRFVSDSAPATDSLSFSTTGIVSSTRTAVDSGSVTEVPGRQADHFPVLSESLPVSESLYSLAFGEDFPSPLSDTVSGLESLFSVAAINRPVLEWSAPRRGAASIWPMADLSAPVEDIAGGVPLSQVGTGLTYRTASPTGYGITFNNSAYLRNLSPSGLPLGASPRTVEFWYQGTSTTKQTVFSYGTNTLRRSFCPAINEGGANRLGIWTWSDDHSVSAPGINDGNWHRLHVVYDGGVTIHFYMDGGLLGSSVLGDALSTALNANGLAVGRDNHTNANLLKVGSSISSIGIWDYAFSQRDVTSYENVTGNPGVRVLASGAEVLFVPSPRMRLRAVGSEVLYIPDPNLRIRRAGAEVLYAPDPDASHARVDDTLQLPDLYETEDSFTRVVPDGLGTGELGEWSLIRGGGFSVNGSEAVVGGGTLGNNDILLPLGLSGLPIEIEMDFRVMPQPGGAGNPTHYEEHHLALVDSQRRMIATAYWYENNYNGLAFTIYSYARGEFIFLAEGRSDWLMWGENYRLRWLIDETSQSLQVWRRVERTFQLTDLLPNWSVYPTSPANFTAGTLSASDGGSIWVGSEYDYANWARGPVHISFDFKTPTPIDVPGWGVGVTAGRHSAELFRWSGGISLSATYVNHGSTALNNLSADTWYSFKAESGTKGQYRFKLWERGATEPGSWTVLDTTSELFDSPGVIWTEVYSVTGVGEIRLENVALIWPIEDPALDEIRAPLTEEGVHIATPEAPGQSWWDVRAVSSDGPAGLQYKTYRHAANYNPVSIDAIRVLQGFPRAHDDIVYELGHETDPGDISDTTSLTEAVGRQIVFTRFHGDTVPANAVMRFDWIARAPTGDEEIALPEYGLTLYDLFDRHEIGEEPPENVMGIATSGWPYPEKNRGAFSLAPLWNVSGALALNQGFIEWYVPIPEQDISGLTQNTGSIGLEFDYWVPFFGGRPWVYFQGRYTPQNASVRVGASPYSTLVVTCGPLSATLDLDGAHDYLRGQIVRFKFVMPHRIGAVYAWKMWIPEIEAEPEGWEAYQVLAHLINFILVSTAIIPNIPGMELGYLGVRNDLPAAEIDRVFTYIDDLVIYDATNAMPGGLAEFIPTRESIRSTVFYFPDDYADSLTEDVATWVPDFINHTVTRYEPMLPEEIEGTLAADADRGDTIVAVVGTPPTYDPDNPLFIDIGGVTYQVVSVSGSTITLGSGLLSAHSAGTPFLLRPVQTSIVIGGVNVTAQVEFRHTRLATYAGGQVGQCEIRIRDLPRTRSVTSGDEIIVRHRGVRVWGGFVKQVKRTYAFSYGDDDIPTAPRFLTVLGVDYNFLLDSRYLYDPGDPTSMELITWPTGTSDATAVSYMIHRHLQLGGDGIGLNIKSTTSVAPFEPFNPASASNSWNQGMATIVDRTRAVYYIDPDKTFNYVDDSVTQSRFGFAGLSDQPDGASTIGYRDFELDYDGTKLVNDQMVWGAGQGTSELVFRREQNSASIAEHGRWQQGEFRRDMYKQESVNRRAQTWLYGSAANRRGHKDDRRHIRCTVFVPYFRVGDVISVHNTSFGFTDTLPVRGAEISFPTPFDIEVNLTISHEIDPPWNTYEWWLPPFPDFKLETPEWEVGKSCVVFSEIVWEPDMPVPFMVGQVPTDVTLPSFTVHYGGRIGGANYYTGQIGGHQWVWIMGGGNYMGYIPNPVSPRITYEPAEEQFLFKVRPIPETDTWYRNQGYTVYFDRHDPFTGVYQRSLPFLQVGGGFRWWHTLTRQWTGAFNYGWGSPIGHLDDGNVFGESRYVWRGNFRAVGNQRLILKLRVDWVVEAWDSFSKPFLSLGWWRTWTLPPGEWEPSFHESEAPGEFWDENEDFFTRLEDFWQDLTLQDIGSALIKSEGTNQSTPSRARWTGSYEATLTPSLNGTYRYTLSYTGDPPSNEVRQPRSNGRMMGSTRRLGANVTVIGVVAGNPIVVNTYQQNDDGTECFPVPLFGEVVTLVQLTNHPSGLVYRFPAAFTPGSTRVFIDGILAVRGVDYFETDPRAGLITLAETTTASVTAIYYANGVDYVDMSGTTLLIPTSGPITGTFGPQESSWPPRDWHGTYYEHFHNGVDFGVATGTGVYASADGIVKHVSESMGGTMIYVHHGLAVFTVYAHLSSRVAADGAPVSAGDLIGYSGATGQVTGAHLHWGLVVNGSPEDPLEYSP